MQPLYKYLPRKYVPAVLERGEVLFRNLTYFRQCEDSVRGDSYEGIHKSHSGSNLVLHNLSNGKLSVGEYSSLKSTNSDFVYTFCLSERLSVELLAEFECDSCIEIFNPQEFIRRVRVNTVRLASVHKAGLIAKNVYYYNPAENVSFDLEDAKEVAFSKNEYYKNQQEFRLCFGTRQAFKLTWQIAQPHHNPFLDSLKGKTKEKLIKIGSIADIARVIVF